LIAGSTQFWTRERRRLVETVVEGQAQVGDVIPIGQLAPLRIARELADEHDLLDVRSREHPGLLASLA
jgi:hypothetical protein